MNVAKYAFFISGQIGIMTLLRFFFQWIVIYAATERDGVMLFPATAVGGVLLGFRILDGITDPLAGRLSDVWVKAGRERRSLLWFSFLAPSVGLVLCFLPDHAMGEGLRWGLLMSGLIIFFAGYTFYAIPYWSLVSDYSPANVPRRRVLSNLLGAGLLLATAVGFVAGPMLVEAKGYAATAIGFAVFAAILMALPYFAAPRRASDSPSGRGQGDDAPADAATSSLWESLKLALGHRRFLGLIFLFSGSQMSFTIMTTAAPFIAIQILGGTRGDVSKLLGPLPAVALPCFLLVPWISARLGWERGMAIGSVAVAVVYTLSGALGSSLIGSPMLTAAILFALGGPMVATLLGLEPEGVVACATERGGQSLVGIYMGVFNFIVKILNGLAIFIAAMLVDYSKTAGDIAIRSMSFTAGSCLVIGVLAYFAVRPRRSPDARANAIAIDS